MEIVNLKGLLEKEILANDIIHIDGWSITHLIGFFILGIYHPNRWGLVITATIAFEIFERYMARRTPFFKEKLKDTFTDILLNFLGYWIGQGDFLW